VSRDERLLAELPAGSIVGTSSLRRKSQLLALRPDLAVIDLRGNVDTRLRKLDEGRYDAIILACAGLQRLGLGDRIIEMLKPPDWLPASTQGIIGLQCRQGDARTLSLIEPLADSDTMVVASAERAVAQVLEATCQVPLAVHAVLENGVVTLKSIISSPDGKKTVQAAGQASATDAVSLGRNVAADLLNSGAGEIIGSL
jgi:hydroxymethylbilane synthase